MDETAKLKFLAGKLGVDLFGVADLARLQGLPVGMGGDPAGLTGKFRYAIVLGAQLNKLGEKATGADLDLFLEKAALQISAYLEKKNDRALIIHPEDEFDPVKRLGLLSLKVLAKAAGLGWQGRSLLIVSPEHGPVHRWIALLTNLELEPGVPLENRCGPLDVLSACCHHTPAVPPATKVVTICPGCDRRYRQNYPEPLSVSIWEMLAGDDDFAFPDYQGRKMTIIDACPTRDQKRIHDAVRTLAARMNIVIVEPDRTREKGTCCGDTFYGVLPTEQVIGQMKAKGSEMPLDEILVYCVSCSKSMFVAGKHPRYLADLLFAEETVPGTIHPDSWHKELDEFIACHKATGDEKISD